MRLLEFLFAIVVSVSTWTTPQPTYSEGLLVIYGGQSLVEANASFRGYNLDLNPGACGISSISPVHLGRIAWVRANGRDWFGPCTVVDVVARRDAYGSIFVRKQVAEITWDTAEYLGFNNGGTWGYVWFGLCPPRYDHHWEQPERYIPPLLIDEPPYERTPSFYPYPAQQRPIDCSVTAVSSDLFLID